MKRISVFLGANPGNNPRYEETTVAMAREIARRGYGVVYGGSCVGLMCTLADAALDAGTEVIGVLPRLLQDKEVAHTGLTELHIVNSMHERKAMMAELSDGFIALPGGAGTMEEIFEVFTWAQIGYHRKPCGLLNVDGYYTKLVDFLNDVVGEGFLREEHRDMLMCSTDPAELLDLFESYTPPTVEKWVARRDNL